MRGSYEPAPATITESDAPVDDSSVKLSVADIENSMKGIDPGTAPGIDKVLLRPIKTLQCAKVISLIGSLMLKFSYVPRLYRQGRTVLIHKSGDDNNIGNFRPITIFPLIRRIIERALDKRVKESIAFCSAQRGFVSVPGTYINASVVNTVLQSAKKDQKDAVVVFLDVQKAFDNIGHDHLSAVINSQSLPTNVKNLLIQLMTQNTIQVEVNGEKTGCIKVNRGVPQGAPLSPTLFNLSIDFMIKELTEESITENFGYKVNDVAGVVSCVAFADDIALLAKNWNCAMALINIALDGLREIGLDINIRKCVAINIVAGRLSPEPTVPSDHAFQAKDIPTLQHGDRVKYLGNNFSDEICLDKIAVLSHLNSTLKELVGTQLLKPDQKLNIVNQFIWPTLIYPLQCAPLKQLTKEFLKDIDIAIRGAVKEILQIPMDTPDDMIYTSRKFRGLGVVRASWEAFLQHINICIKLEALHDPFLAATRNLEGEIRECLNHLNIDPESDARAKQLRAQLRQRSYESWCSMPVKGQGVVQYQEYPVANKWIINKEGLSSSQWTNAIKMSTNCAAVRGIKGRCGDVTSCRHTSICKKNETLTHVLQDCPQGELLRTSRHHKVRDMLEEGLKSIGLTVYHEVRCTDVDGRERRADLVVIDRYGITSQHISTVKGYILDPTVRFETHQAQAADVDTEKKSIYEPTVPFFQRTYGVEEWEVIGLYVGARGSITEFLKSALSRLGLPKSILQDISCSVLRDSLGILHHHLYSKSR